jgi:hypothetical protein
VLLVAAATGRELAAALGLAQAPGQEQLQGRLFPAQAHGRPVLALVTGIGVVNAALALGARHGADGDFWRAVRGRGRELRSGRASAGLRAAGGARGLAPTTACFFSGACAMRMPAPWASA